MDILIFAVEFTVAMFLGSFVVSVIVVPIFYGLPLAFYRSLKRVLRFSSVVPYIVGSLLWFIVLNALMFAISFFWPKLFWHLATSDAVAYGFLFGFVLTLLRGFLRSGRADLRQDFWSVMNKYRR